MTDPTTDRDQGRTFVPLHLRPYQIETLEFARRRPVSILALDPGLGKTAVAIHAAKLPALVVCPASVLLHWKAEIEKWRPGGEGLFQIISYASPWLQHAQPRDYETLIIDEAHMVKNPEAQRTKVVLRLAHQVPNVMALSGTLPPNRPIELWPLLFATGITKLSYEAFAYRYAAAYVSPFGKGQALDVRGASNLPELREMLRPHAIRFQKKDVLDELPPATLRMIDLAEWDVVEEELEFSLEKDSLTLLRCGHPVPFEAMSEILHEQGLAKVGHAISYLRNLLDGGLEKVVVLAKHLDVLKEIEKGLLAACPVLVTGSTSPKDRQRAVEQFGSVRGCRVFLGQRDAVGTGTDGLQDACSHLVHVEAPWSPGELAQQVGRLHRMGQRDNVTADILTIKGSIDHYVLKRVIEKSEVIEEIWK
jgi:SNF2 family DNA or RNA helicase